VISTAKPTALEPRQRRRDHRTSSWLARSLQHHTNLPKSRQPTT